MAENQNKKTFISLGSSLVAMGLSMVISFFLSPYIVTNFGEEANGFTQLANNFINYATLITVALNSMAGRFMTVAYHRGDITACKKYYSSVLIGNLIIIAVLLLPASYLVIRLESLLKIETATVLHVKLLFGFVFANFFLSQVNSIFSTVFYITNSQYIQNIINMVRTVLNAGGLVLLFSAFLPKIYYVGLIGCSLSLLLMPVFALCKRKLLPEIKFDVKMFDLKVIWEMVSSGIWNAVTQCGNLLMTGLDLLLANLFISPVQMGVLSVAKVVPNTIIQLGATVNTNFSPNLTIAYAEKDRSKILASLRYAMKCSSVLMGIPITVLCIFGDSFYSLWVPTMDAVELSVLSVLSCMAFIPCSGTQVLYNVFTTTNKLKLNSLLVLACGLLNFAVVYILLSFTNLGLFAVAGVSSLITTLRNIIFVLPYCAKLLDLKWYIFYKDMLQSCAIAVATGVICYFAKVTIMPESWLMLVVSVGIACIISMFALVLILFNKLERTQLYNKILRRKSNG